MVMAVGMIMVMIIDNNDNSDDGFAESMSMCKEN